MKKSVRKALLFLLILSFLLLAVAPGTALAEEFRLVKPNGGETLLVGASYTLTWTGAPDSSSMEVWLSLDSGASYDISLGSGSNGSFTFTVPDHPTKNARIQLIGIIGSIYIPLVGSAPLLGSDTSDADFTIMKLAVIQPIPILPLQPVIPNAPTELRSVTAGTEAVQISWTDNSSMEAGFRIQRRTGGSGSWNQVAEVAANQTSFIDIGPHPAGTGYEYRVLAFNSAGESGYSNQISVSIPVPPVTPEPVPDPQPSPEPVVIRLKIGNRSYSVNRSPGQMDTAPMIIGGRTLLPIRYVADPLGASLGWDKLDSKASVQMGATLIDLWIGKNQAMVNGVPRFIDPGNASVTPLIVPPGRTMLPLRFIAEALGCDVVWNPGDDSVTITWQP